jgi:hypothetical protein
VHSGGQRPAAAASGVFGFERELGRRFLIALNFRSDRVPLALRGKYRGPAWVELSTYPGRASGPSTCLISC